MTVAVCEGVCAALSDQKPGGEVCVAVGNQESLRHLSGKQRARSSQSPHFMAEGNPGKLARLSLIITYKFLID